MNAANEAAVAAFLAGRIAFYDIPKIIEKVCNGTVFASNPSARDILATHEEAIARAREMIV